MKRIGKFPIRVIGIIDRRLFDVKQKKKKKYGIQFFRIFFFKKIVKIHRVYQVSDYSRRRI